MSRAWPAEGEPSSSLGVSTTTGTPATEGWASSSANGPRPIEPSPIVVCRSRFEPHSSSESLACTSPSRPGPTVASSASSVAVIPPGTERSCPAAHAWHVSKQTPTSGWFSSAAKQAQLLDRGGQRLAAAGRRLDQQPRAVVRQASSTGSSRSCNCPSAAS